MEEIIKEQDFFEKMEVMVQRGKSITVSLVIVNAVVLLMDFVNGFILGNVNIIRLILWVIILYGISEGKTWAKGLYIGLIIFGILGLFMLFASAGISIGMVFEVIPTFVAVNMVIGFAVQITTVILLIRSKSVNEYMYAKRS